MKSAPVLIIIILARLCVAGEDAPSSPTVSRRREMIERVVAVVDDSIITQTDLENKIRRELCLMDVIPEKFHFSMKKRFLAELIDEEILLQRARRKKIESAYEIVTSAAEKFIKDVRVIFPDDDTYYKHIEEHYGGFLEFKKTVEKWEERDYLIRVFVSENVSLTDQEIRDYEETLKKEGKAINRYRLSHLYRRFPVNATEEEKLEVEQALLDILKRIQAGEDFARLIEKHSEDYATRRKGGDLGVVEKGSFAKPLEDAVQGLREGEISLPIRSESGAHLLRLENKIDARDRLFQKKFTEAKNVMIKELREKTSVRILDQKEME